MLRRIWLEKAGEMTLVDRDFIGSGGEADVYHRGDLAFKLYHRPERVISPQKIAELQKINQPNVVIPEGLLFHPESKAPMGFYMKYWSRTHPLVKLFGRGFKKRQGISAEVLTRLIGVMATTLRGIHEAGCLGVDLNEMNFLVCKRFESPIFIDTDSYQTPSFGATAVMETVRDPLAEKDEFSRAGDWFALAVLAFQLYMGIHPYKGGHRDYKPGSWRLRMKDGISAFHPGAGLPPSCPAISTIPKPHFDWLRAVFVNRERSAPPEVLTSRQAASPDIHLSRVNTTFEHRAFEAIEINRFPAEILAVFPVFENLYTVTEGGIFRNGSLIWTSEASGPATVAQTPDGQPILALFDGETITFRSIDKAYEERMPCRDYFWSEGAFYTLNAAGHLIVHRFERFGGRIIRKFRLVSRIGGAAILVGEAVVFQSILGKTWVSLPTGNGFYLMSPVPFLDGYRLLEAKYQNGFCQVLAERGGRYDRFWLMSKGERYQRVEDVPGELNFTVLPNGVCVALNRDNCLELFRNPAHIQSFRDHPLDVTMKLFCRDGAVHFTQGRRIYRLSSK